MLNLKAIVLTEVLSIKKHLKNLFPSLSLDEIIQLEKLGNSFLSYKGDLIFKQDETCEGLLILTNGKACIKLEKETKNNIVHFLKPGDSFYSCEAYIQTTNNTSCYCMETSMIYILPVNALKSFCIQNPSFLINILNTASKESELLEHRATNLVALPVKFRFIDSLLTLIKKFGEEKTDHWFIPIKRDEIGSYINASKASLSRIVTELENSNIIQTSRKGIKVYDAEALLDN